MADHQLLVLRSMNRISFIMMTMVLITMVITIESFEWDQSRVERDLKPSVVSIRRHTELPFEGSTLGEFIATGFVVHSRPAVIATNRHVTGSSPSFYKVTFYDGSLRDATLLYYDPLEDFAFLRVSDEVCVRSSFFLCSLSPSICLIFL